MRSPFAEVLDKCLDRVVLRGESIEACVADYPEFAAELREGLATALGIRQAAVFQPDADRKRSARLRMLAAMEQRGARRRWLPRGLRGFSFTFNAPGGPSPSPHWYWQWSWEAQVPLWRRREVFLATLSTQ